MEAPCPVFLGKVVCAQVVLAMDNSLGFQPEGFICEIVLLLFSRSCISLLIESPFLF